MHDLGTAHCWRCGQWLRLAGNPAELEHMMINVVQKGELCPDCYREMTTAEMRQLAFSELSGYHSPHFHG